MWSEQLEIQVNRVYIRWNVELSKRGCLGGENMGGWVGRGGGGVTNLAGRVLLECSTFCEHITSRCCSHIFLENKQS